MIDPEEIKQAIQKGDIINPMIVHEMMLGYFSVVIGRTKRVIVCNRCAKDWDQKKQQEHLAHYGQPTVIVEPA